VKARKVRLIFSIVIILVALLGMIIPGKDSAKYSGMSKVLSKIKLGLDIQGGSSLEYDLKVDSTAKAQDIIDNVILVLRKRLDIAGYTEASVAKVVSNGKIRVRVEIPGISDTSKAEKLIGSKGKLYFAEVLETKVSDVKPTLLRNRTLEIDGNKIKLYDYVQDKDNATKWYKVKRVFEYGE